jgi:pimeloyl-ACP methyl ester carboxylesterase
VTQSSRESFTFGPDGTRLYVRERPAPGLVTILCDGIVCDGYIWKYLWDELAGKTSLAHWHYRGHGRSALPEDADRIDVAAHAADLDAVRRHLGDRPAVLVGHSLGCQIVLEAFRQRREQIVGLVLLCGSSGRVLDTFHGTDILARVLPEVMRAAEARPELFRSLWRKVPIDLSVRVALASGEVDKRTLNPDDLVPYLEHATRMDFLLFLRMLKAVASYSADAFLPSIDVPVLVVAGQNDRFTPCELSRQMAAAMPRAELLVVHGATHVALLEQPELVGGRIARFLTEVSGRPAAAGRALP